MIFGRFELVIKMKRIAFSNDNEKFPRTRSIQNVGSNRTNFVVTRPFLAGGISDFNCLNRLSYIIDYCI